MRTRLLRTKVHNHYVREIKYFHGGDHYDDVLLG
jgi:hypothetical protein